jgi:predicted nucleic acid-binding protein
MTPVTVDTSLWVDHLRRGRADLAAILRQARAVIHPFIIGELACGDLRNRKEILALVHALPMRRVVTHDEALAFIEAHSLMGIGLGYTDIHLLASCVLDRVPLWTRDNELRTAAKKMGVAYG